MPDAGGGYHDTEFSRMGYRVTGVDQSFGMIETAAANAKKNGVSIKYLQGDIRSFNPQEKYDAVISLFHVMSYQNTNQDLLDAFSSCRSAVKEGAVFLFDAWYGPGVLRDIPAVRVKKAEAGNKSIIRIASPRMHDKDNLVDVSYEILVIDNESRSVQKIEEIHKMRYLFKPEIELILNQSGFRLIDILDCNTLGDTDYSSWTCYFIAKAE